MFPDPEQIEIEFPDEEPEYLYESDFYEAEPDLLDPYTLYDPGMDIDWDYGDDSEDEEFLSE